MVFYYEVHNSFSCNHCGQSIEAPKEYRGIVLDCPTCQQKTLCPPVSERFRRKSAVIFKAAWKVWKPVVVFLLVIFKAAWKVAWIRAVVFLSLILLVGFVFFPEHLSTLILVGLYFLPSFIAYSRKHLNLGAVFVANLFLGWTVLGWVLCLVWALVWTKTKKFWYGLL